MYYRGKPLLPHLLSLLGRFSDAVRVTLRAPSGSGGTPQGETKMRLWIRRENIEKFRAKEGRSNDHYCSN